ncbi:[F-actin]-monooxygenase MICAL2 (Molecule interacting with CasL protein 2) (MICAL-2) (mMical2) [Durusdinium trenchii]|uniref:[F-actin]-monooxygenase MICAL2 (Molecule interacting with CasL protein 2) (MICAL-2) (MMical2) n=1 Tax=Durusdinium trenchii TaxID=1381693 RepID=A0ABP0H5C1_9DINO
MSLTQKDLEELARTKTVLLKEFFQAEPPSTKGEDILELWRQIYDEVVQSTVIETVQGPSDVNNPVFPYEKLQAMVGDGGHWKWPRIWRRFDELERRGTAYRRGDPVNFEIPNSNPNIVPQSILIVGGGPVGLRLAIELKLGGHEVTIFEKRREVRNSHGELQQLGFTNRINRPHVFNFLRNDLDRLNGRDFMSSKMCYPVFTQGDTSSIGIDELQLLLMKNALLLGVDFQLGMSYEDAEVTLDPKSQKPQWQVTFSCDDLAAEQRGMAPGRHVRKFDILMGCDGARSRVRESQHRIFGDVDKRNFKKMIGVVANLQKVSRQRLKELGFPSGQEPTDMKRAHLASGAGNMAGLNYYKASYHNYVIFTPSKEDLQQAGFGGSVYSFHAGRDKVNPNKLEEKLHLKQWVLERCKEVGIPVDESLSNGGFVEAPNDVMAFDFSEIWKCKKNFAFNLPPPGYDADVHGPWTGASLVPPIGLVGDSVTEPFWIAGVGLQRGWNGAMDACYLIDNLYNMSFSGESEPLEITSWNEHVQKLQAMIPKLYDCSHDGRMTREGLQGEHADQGVVMMQLNKQMKDCEKPQWQLHVDPFYRYEQFAKQVEEKYRGAKILENMHPVVRRTLAIRKPLEGEKSEQSFSRKLLSVNGKELAMVPEAFDHVPKQKESVDAVPVTRIPDMGFVISEPEVARRATEKSENLQAMLSKQIDVHLQRSSSSTAAFDDERWVPISPKQGFAELAEKQWDVMTEKHLSPTQRAELLHIRNMIKSLNHQIAAIDVPLPYFDALAEQLEMRAEQVYDRVTAVEKALATYNRQVSGVPVSAQIEAVVRSEFLQFKAIAAELVQTLLEVCLVSTLEQVSLEDSSIPVGACLARTLVEDSSVPILVEDSSVPILVEACSVAKTLVEDSSVPILAEACSAARTPVEDSSVPIQVEACSACSAARTLVEDSSVPILAEACLAAKTLVEDSSVPILAEACSAARTLVEDSSVPILVEACSVARTLAEDSSVPILVEACSVRTLVGDSLVPILVEVCLVPTLVEVCSESSCPIDCRKRCLDATGQKVILHEDITNTYMIESGLRTHLSDGADDMNDRAGIWEWLESSILPRLFAQTDYLGQPYQNKTEWSRVLTYNQIVGPVIIEQQRSKKAWCNDGDGVTGDMYCYSQRTRSSAAFGSQDILPIASPTPNEYAGGNSTVDQRRAYWDSAFQVQTQSSRRLARTMRPEFDIMLPRPQREDNYVIAIYPNTPLALIHDHLQYVKAKEWLDAKSKLVNIRALLINAEVGRPRLQMFSFHIAFSRGGGLFTYVRMNTIFLKSFANVASIVVDILFATHLFGILLMELYRLGRAVGRREARRHLKKGWTILQALTIIGGVAVIVGYCWEFMLRDDVRTAYESVAAHQVQDMPADTNNDGLALIEKADNMNEYMGNFRIVTGLYCLLCMVRFFTSFSAQPRLAVVTTTLEVSAFDIVHFLVVLAPTWLAYALAGCFIFGRRMEEFATLDASIGYCFKLMIEGEYDWPYYAEENYFTTMFWMWTFMVLLNVIMLNLVLAIILDVYGSIRRETGKSETAWLTLWRMLLQLYRRRVWVRSTNLLEALPEMPDEIKEDDLLARFPKMCKEQMHILMEACYFQVSMDDLAAADGQRAMKMALSCKMAIDQVTDTVKALHDGTDETGGPDHPGSGWVKKLADEMAEQNHLMMKLQSKLMLVEKQWQALATKAASARF